MRILRNHALFTANDVDSIVQLGGTGTRHRRESRRRLRSEAAAPTLQPHHDREQKLEAVGFNVGSDSDLSVRYDAPRALRNSIDESVRSKLGTERDIERKYNYAIVKILAADTAEEVAKVIERFSNQLMCRFRVSSG